MTSSQGNRGRPDRSLRRSGEDAPTPRERRGEAGQEMLRSIGAHLRSQRLARKLTLQQVADSTGLTKGFLSQLERGDSSASISSLLALCSVLDISIASLMEQASDRALADPVVRPKDRVPMYLGGEGVADQLLSPPSDRRFEVFVTHVDPLGSPGQEPYSLEADLGFAYVLQGRLEFLWGPATYTLSRGDAITYAPREPHTFRNPSTTRKSVVLFMKSPAVF